MDLMSLKMKVYRVMCWGISWESYKTVNSVFKRKALTLQDVSIDLFQEKRLSFGHIRLV